MRGQSHKQMTRKCVLSYGEFLDEEASKTKEFNWGVA